MKLLEKILLAIDFSRSSENIVENAIVMAKIFQSKIILIHVLPDDIKNEKVRLSLNEAAIKQLGVIRERIENEGVNTDEPLLKFGCHYDKIIQMADSINANVIMVGAGEKSKNDVFQLGTTAGKIIRKSIRPVWVIKKDNPLNVKSILCPVDFFPESKRALKNAITMAHRFNAELIIFSVCELYYKGSLKLKIDWDEESEYLRSEHIKKFDSFLEDFNLTDLNWQKEIRNNDPAKEILGAISRHKSDILIMGTTGKTGLSRLIMGRVTEKVIREVPCSFITLKSKDIIATQFETKIRDIELHGSTARQLEKDGFFNESISEFEACQNINSMHIPSLNGIAKVYEKLDDMDNAEKYKNMAREVLARIW
ncbi:MAG: universal stress protein, partial [Cyclobacteriaceae bacterium]|nr:universal stress protein [Cyclobacteriaceae bacterium]